MRLQLPPVLEALCHQERPEETPADAEQRETLWLPTLRQELPAETLTGCPHEGPSGGRIREAGFRQGLPTKPLSGVESHGRVGYWFYWGQTVAGGEQVGVHNPLMVQLQNGSFSPWETVWR